MVDGERDRSQAGGKRKHLPITVGVKMPKFDEVVLDFHWDLHYVRVGGGPVGMRVCADQRINHVASVALVERNYFEFSGRRSTQEYKPITPCPVPHRSITQSTPSSWHRVLRIRPTSNAQSGTPAHRGPAPKMRCDAMPSDVSDRLAHKWCRAREQMQRRWTPPQCVGPGW